MYIILEYYILENFIINFLILYITMLITKTKSNIKEIILGAGFSAVYSLIFFYPPLLFLGNFYMKILISIIIVKLTFKSKSFRLFFYQLLGFYTISFIFAGVIVGISWGRNNPANLILNRVKLLELFKVKYIILGLIIAAFVSKKIFNYTNKKNTQRDYIIDVEVFLNGKSSTITALIDTGNSLVDPLTNRPVFVVEFHKIKDLLPKDIDELYLEDISKGFGSWESLLTKLNSDIPLVVIPFKSIGNDSGIILGFKPDYLIIKSSEEGIVKKDIVIGIYNGQLSSEMEYSGLLHYETMV
ncbi:sigma-E processing peptidase SpoIIGA [Wansuia hejianensis]|uniref:Sporulation sigma-E factor-processing peptidase n=1 Tax=Wansuia hejianensis TaxID=2763667 RepID=A0A926F2F3_9FIRM|nr:sigma-E processing peptidase SpoIIGA [Wansuia hejianensis]MBC8590704.1 sigma-E processing peptidase SpoIIGA [Wansuia hejianensis]